MPNIGLVREELHRGVSLPLTFELVVTSLTTLPRAWLQADDNQLPVLPLFAFSMTATQILEKCTFADFPPPPQCILPLMSESSTSDMGGITCRLRP